MANKLFRDNLIIKIKGAIEEANKASLIDHTYLIGRIREIAITNLFKPILSDNFSLGTGKITDSNGVNSNESDILIYSKKSIPPLMFSSDFGYFPTESVFASIEVKSKLTLTELKDIKKKFENLNKLKMNSGFFTKEHEGIETIVTGIIKSVFAFSTDLTNKNELERLFEEFKICKTEPFLNSICVVGKGYWTFDYNAKKWLHTKATDEYEEVIRFLSSLANGLNDALLSRGNPRIGGYFTNENPTQIDIK